MARPKIPAKLQKKWEDRLRAEGLAPLTAHAAAETRQRRRLTVMAGEAADVSAYYTRAMKFLRRIEMAHAIWTLHCEGKGRRDIAEYLGLGEKLVRAVLERLQGISGLVPPSYGGNNG